MTVNHTRRLLRGEESGGGAEHQGGGGEGGGEEGAGLQEEGEVRGVEGAEEVPAAQAQHRSSLKK